MPQGAGGGNGLRVDNGGPGTVTATNNWWGCNNGPSAAPCDTAILDGAGAGIPPATLNFNPWLRAVARREPQFGRCRMERAR